MPRENGVIGGLTIVVRPILAAMAHVDPILEELTGPGQLFEVEEAVVLGLSMRVYKNRPRNLRDLLAIGMSHGDLEYLVQGEVRHTFLEAITRALSVAGALHDRFGIQSGDRVAVVGANTPDWVIAYWAVIAAQGVVVPFNAWWKAAELQFGIEDSGTSLVLCDARRAAAVVEAGFPVDRIVVWGQGDRPEGVTAFESLAAGEPAALDFAETRGEDETAGLFYTSGTTGRPKGSANTHHNIITNLMNFGVLNKAQAIAAGEPPSGEKATYLCIIPLFHATANFTYMVPFMFAGHKLVFLPPGKFEADAAGRVIQDENVTAIGGVPTIMARLIDDGVHERYDLSSVTAIGYGGAPASAALLEKINGAFPNLKKKVSTAYGLTETSAIATATGGLDYQEHPSSVGQASPVNDVRIAEFDGTPRPKGETGEIWLRGPNVVPGYWERPEANARSFVDGWFRSGDVGYIDSEGFVYITDRAKDMVIRGGENIYCVEVESTLEAHPAVAEVAVIGVPHAELGEELKAIIVVAPGATADADELKAFARTQMADFKVPAYWEFRTDPLPRNPAGKVLKAPLRGDHSAVFSVGEESDSAL
jgi:long-chain acyl-CoA synthetase